MKIVYYNESHELFPALCESDNCFAFLELDVREKRLFIDINCSGLNPPYVEAGHAHRYRILDNYDRNELNELLGNDKLQSLAKAVISGYQVETLMSGEHVDYTEQGKDAESELAYLISEYCELHPPQFEKVDASEWLYEWISDPVNHKEIFSLKEDERTEYLVNLGILEKILYINVPQFLSALEEESI